MYSPGKMKTLLFLFSLFSRIVSQIKNFLYAWHIFRPRAAHLPVISIGNIALGGTEKTPFAMQVLEWLFQAGRRPALVSRGYRSRWEKRGGILQDGKSLLGTWEDGGDEPFLAARNFPQAGVFVGKNRLASCRRAKELGFDIVVLDDGFQHRRLHRDLDIVLFSPQEKLAIREPRSALQRADLVLIKKDAPCRVALDNHPRFNLTKVISYSVVAAGFFSAWNMEAFPGSELAKKRITAFCGIARPRRFFDLLAKTGLEVAASWTFPDHYPYSRAALQKIVRCSQKAGAEAMVTTEKDSVKLLKSKDLFGGLPLYFLKIKVQPEPVFFEALSLFLEQECRN